MIKQNKSTVVSVQSAMVSRFGVRSTYKRRFLKLVQVTMKHDPFDARQESTYTFTSILHLYTPLVPQAYCDANSDSLRLFPPMRVLEVYWSRALSLVCEVALNLTIDSNRAQKLGEFKLTCEGKRERDAHQSNNLTKKLPASTFNRSTRRKYLS